MRRKGIGAAKRSRRTKRFTGNEAVGPTAVGEGPDRLLAAHAELAHTPPRCLGTRERQSPLRLVAFE